MRVFCAGIGTETNTFSPLPTGLDEFRAGGYYPAGQHPEQMTRYAAPLIIARERAREEGWTLLEGMFTGAQPGGLTTRVAYESLRDELLSDLKRVLPVDIVLLGLHGAMVADGYDDCEGDLIARVRQLVGPSAVIGAELDPHAHLSSEMVDNATLLIAYKEYPHTDIKERAVELVDLCVKAFAGEIQPVAAVVDTKMVVPIHTSRDPGRSFVDKLSAMEGKDGVLSLSAIQGFATGDVPSMGTKVLVYTDSDKAAAQTLAKNLADELISLRDKLRVNYLSVDDALDIALAEGPTPAILADRADNPGSGAAGDSTFILKRLLERKISNAALGPLWDPIAVQMAFSAGVGARMSLRIGGKISPMSGDPVDAACLVKVLKRDHVMTGQTGEPLLVGDSALIDIEGVECVLISVRTQAINVDVFTGLGCDIASKKVVVVKSAQHFYASFSTISTRVLYVGAPGSATPRYDQLTYRKAVLPKWPITLD
ncbi:M81 family metallopeptidase [Paraburkholderia sp. Ac-20336]|uniref:M81 family metallopeptidase n=1 Tax=unclassified Paraburkholderia TaxID=2615204 RepID=UPI00197E2B98|nr:MULTISPECIES: M81 family metallopeptidase [unclassified Paraburkholderia]MBN3804369.1 M81 family metallopeptidase [Paraburkholderia sp. Ac-20336]MBN3851375.1 M81 family metallopeptidase [Paraburkholderia sp. Ac-20342]